MNKKPDDIDFSKIEFVLFDLDGVLTDGTIFYTPLGDRLKMFHAHDGYGIFRGHELGLKFGVITGKIDPVNVVRIERLKIQEMYQDCQDKVAAYKEIKMKYGLEAENFCFMGDDVFDLPLLREVAFSCAPANAIQEVCDEVDYVTTKESGRGAAREVIDLILRRKKLL